jgi:acyl-CoA dehydrogenase
VPTSSTGRLGHLQLPFFEDGHRALAAELDVWAALHLQAVDHHDTDASCRALVRALGEAGFLRHCVPAAFGGASPALDSRALVVCRETLARHDGLADFAFAMQGLGSGPITLAGTPALQAELLPRVARGECITAFALSEPEAGSDVAAMACSARDEGEHVVLNGEKTWISNGGIADVYCVFVRDLPPGSEPPARGTKGLSAYLVQSRAPPP